LAVFRTGVGGHDANLGGSVQRHGLADAHGIEVGVFGAIEEDVNRCGARARDVEPDAARGGCGIRGEVSGESHQGVRIAVKRGQALDLVGLDHGGDLSLFKLHAREIVRGNGDLSLL
jgi:hypothetical protein